MPDARSKSVTEPRTWGFVERMIRSDLRNKQIALGRIKRLASSGLRLEPFVRTLFDLINDAVPNSPNKVFHIGGLEQLDSYLGSTPEIAAATPIQKQFFVDSPPEVGGVKFCYDSYAYRHILPQREIWTHEDLWLPDWRMRDGYNVVYRPLGWHRMVQVVYREAGEYMGYCPIWRSANQKPFSSDDIAFLKASAPHIAHGLTAARLLSRVAAIKTEDEFLPLNGWGIGVVWLNASATPIAMDTAARLIFQQIAVFDGLGTDAFDASPVRRGLEYVASRIGEIFGTVEQIFYGSAPVYRLYQHWSGTLVKFRGIRMASQKGPACTTVLIERGETSAARQQRFRLRWGLTDREAGVLSLVSEGKTGPEISIILGISHDTARKHTSRILEKLGVETRAAAASIAREAYIDTTPDDR